MTEDGQLSSVLSICKLLPQKWKLRHVRRRVFRPSAAENVERIRRGATDVVICRTHDKLRAGRALTELSNHEMIAKLWVVEQHIIPFKPRRVDRVVIISVVAERDIRRADDVLLEYSSSLCLFWLLFHHKICEHNATPDHSLLANDAVSAMQKKRFCCDKGVRRDGLSVRETLQFVADRRCNALSLIVLADIQPVQIAAFIQYPRIRHSHHFLSQQPSCAPERRVPCLHINRFGHPRIQLFLRIVLGLEKEFRHQCPVRRCVFSKLHMLSSQTLIYFSISLAHSVQASDSFKPSSCQIPA